MPELFDYSQPIEIMSEQDPPLKTAGISYGIKEEEGFVEVGEVSRPLTPLEYHILASCDENYADRYERDSRRTRSDAISLSEISASAVELWPDDGITEENVSNAYDTLKQKIEEDLEDSGKVRLIRSEDNIVFTEPVRAHELAPLLKISYWKENGKYFIQTGETKTQVLRQEYNILDYLVTSYVINNIQNSKSTRSNAIPLDEIARRFKMKTTIKVTNNFASLRKKVGEENSQDDLVRLVRMYDKQLIFITEPTLFSDLIRPETNKEIAGVRSAIREDGKSIIFVDGNPTVVNPRYYKLLQILSKNFDSELGETTPPVPIERIAKKLLDRHTRVVNVTNTIYELSKMLSERLDYDKIIFKSGGIVLVNRPVKVLSEENNLNDDTHRNIE